jgi:hypothetical protein
MKVSDWSNEQIETLIGRYRDRGIVEGGKFTLSELLIEQKKRAPSRFGGAEVVKGIIELARRSVSGVVTYGELYHYLSDGLPWKGNATQRDMGNALERGISHCVENRLPVLTVLVIRQSGSLSPEAVQRIYTEAKEFGLDVGLNADSFVALELEKCKAFIRQDIEKGQT